MQRRLNWIELNCGKLYIYTAANTHIRYRRALVWHFEYKEIHPTGILAAPPAALALCECPRAFRLEKAYMAMDVAYAPSARRMCFIRVYQNHLFLIDDCRTQSAACAKMPGIEPEIRSIASNQTPCSSSSSWIPSPNQWSGSSGVIRAEFTARFNRFGSENSVQHRTSEHRNRRNACCCLHQKQASNPCRDRRSNKPRPATWVTMYRYS